MLDKLLEFENSSKVLEFRLEYKDTLIWPLVRIILFRRICELSYTENSKNIINVDEDCISSKITKLLRGNPFMLFNKKIVFLYSAGSNVMNDDNIQYNRLYDCFANIYPRSTYMFENARGKKYAKRNAQNIKYSEFIDYYIERRAKKEFVNEKDKKTIDDFILYLKGNLPVRVRDSVLVEVRNALLEYAKSVLYYDKVYKNLFNRVKPRVVFVEDGCYGGKKALIIRILNEMQIPCAELQHGWVGKIHEAYNYSDLIMKSKEYSLYLPKFFLTWGDFWTEGVKIPIRKETLGYSQIPPTLNGKLKNIKKITNKTILFIAGPEHQEYIKFFEELFLLLDKTYTLKLRLHPSEKNAKKWYIKFEKYSNFKIETEGTLWDSLLNSEIVVGDFSTALFEATILKKRILILKDRISDMYDVSMLGTKFSKADEFVHLLQENRTISMANNKFDLDWKNNYKKFIKKII